MNEEIDDLQRQIFELNNRCERVEKELMNLKVQMAPSNAVELKNAMRGHEMREMQGFVESRIGVFGCDLVTSTDVSMYLKETTGRNTFTPHKCGKLLSLITGGNQLTVNRAKTMHKVWCLRGSHDRDRGVDRYDTWLYQRKKWLSGAYAETPPPQRFEFFDFS